MELRRRLNGLSRSAERRHDHPSRSEDMGLPAHRVWAWKGSQFLGGQYIRFVATLLAMQGLGKPGVGMYSTSSGKAGTALWRDGVKGYPSAANWGETGLVNHETSEQIFGTWRSGLAADSGKTRKVWKYGLHDYPQLPTSIRNHSPTFGGSICPYCKSS